MDYKNDKSSNYSESIRLIQCNIFYFFLHSFTLIETFKKNYKLLSCLSNTTTITYSNITSPPPTTTIAYHTSDAVNVRLKAVKNSKSDPVRAPLAAALSNAS